MPLTPAILERRNKALIDQEESRESPIFFFGERHPLLLYRSPKVNFVAKKRNYFQNEK